MLNYSLPAEKLAELRAAHHCTRDKREADRIEALVLLASDWRAEDVADELLIDANSVRNYFMTYQANRLSGLGHLANRGSECALSESALNALDVHVQEGLDHNSAHPRLCRHRRQTGRLWGARSSTSGGR